MALKIENLERMAGGGAGFAIWGYATTDDAKADVVAAGYFNAAGDMLRVHDWVFVRATDGHGIAIVNQNASETVDVTDLTAVGGSDGS